MARLIPVDIANKSPNRGKRGDHDDKAQPLLIVVVAGIVSAASAVVFLGADRRSPTATWERGRRHDPSARGGVEPGPSRHHWTARSGGADSPGHPGLDEVPLARLPPTSVERVSDARRGYGRQHHHRIHFCSG